MGDVGLEVKTNDEPVFGSGRIIEDIEQKEKDLVDTGGEMVPRKVVAKLEEDFKRDMDM